MERTVTHPVVPSPPRPAVARPWAPVPDLSRLRPLWRYAAFGGCLFLVTAFAVAVRLDVQQMRKDLHQNARMQREALILNDRLRLEMDARRRAAAMEVVAARMALGAEAQIVRVEGVNE